MLSLRRYIFVALGFALGLLALGYLAGAPLAGWLNTVKAAASGFGIFTSLVIDPLIYVMQNPLPGALIAGLLWPAVVVLLALLFVMVIIAYGSGAAQAVQGQIQ